MEVRRLSVSDLHALRALRLRALKEHPRDFGAAYEDEVGWPEARWRTSLAETIWFGAEQGAALVARAVLRIPGLVKLRHNGWVHAMYVAPEARGSEAGRVLIDAIETAARSEGVAILKLLASEGNDAARRFYEKCGFVQYGLEPDSHRVDGKSYNSVEMLKRLS
jgi:GNAT superfamily N-acetyltransferase